MVLAKKVPVVKRRYFDWLVDYQVKEMRWSDIARSADLTPGGIKNGVYNAAPTLVGAGWRRWLRKPLLGYPRGRKRSP